MVGETVANGVASEAVDQTVAEIFGKEDLILAMSWCWKNDGGRWSNGELKQLGFDSVASRGVGQGDSVREIGDSLSQALSDGLFVIAVGCRYELCVWMLRFYSSELRGGTVGH
ncbi:hypothetical protein F0562_017722 [Nyssa sinensis]|uniref:Uncharacterized protein n=1 Tax=Nyssa sinensis TaxID=561372 RepID=A0A5J4ZH95_9ASTE|nr:hypothetical protein F0562_017722 [Nyssa sinensis]